MKTTRRELVGHAALAAVPVSLVGAATAFAQETDETDALEPVAELEQAAELAYSIAVEDSKLDKQAKETFELFAAHCGDHATALSEALDQLGVDPPEAKSDFADYKALSDFDPKGNQDELLKFMEGIEGDLVAAYEDATGKLEAEDLVRTAAQVGAAHAQMLVALRLLLGADPQKLTELD